MINVTRKAHEKVKCLDTLYPRDIYAIRYHLYNFKKRKTPMEESYF